MIDKAHDKARDKEEDTPSIRSALDAYAGGMDVADALHLASSAKTARFATFDEALLRRAAKMTGSVPVTTPG